MASSSLNAGFRPLITSPAEQESQIAQGTLDLQSGFRPINPMGAPAAQESDGYLDDVQRGLKESFIPFALTKEDFNKPRTFGESMVQLGTNILADIGTSVLAGAAVGSVVPGAGTLAGGGVGAVTGLGLAVYRGLGYEAAKARVEGRSFSPLKGAVNVATEGNPLFRHGSALSKGLTQAGLQFAQAKQYGADNVGAGVAAALGGTLGAVTNKAAFDLKSRKVAGATALVAEADMSPKAIQDIADFVTDNIDAIDAGVARRLDEAAEVMEPIKDTLRKDLVKADVTLEEFSAHAESVKPLLYQRMVEDPKIRESLPTIRRSMQAKLGRKPTEAEVETQLAFDIWRDEMTQMAGYFLRTQGREFKAKNAIDKLRRHVDHSNTTLESVWNGYRTYKAMLAEFDEMGEEASKKLGLGVDPMSNVFRAKLSDPVFGARAIERQTNITVEPLLNELHYAKQRHSTFSAPRILRIVKTRKQAEKAKVDGREVWKLLDSNLADEADTPAHLAARELRDMFDEMKAYARENNIDIQDLLPGEGSGGYVTHAMVDADEALYKLNSAVESWRSMKRGSAEWTNQHSTIMRYVYAMTGKRPGTVKKLNKVIEQINSQPTKIKGSSGIEVGASFRRTGELPDELLDKDPYKLAARYVSAISNAVHMNGALNEIRPVIAALDALKLKNSANWLRRTIGDYSGKQGGLAASMANSMTRWKAFHRKLEAQGREMGGLRGKVTEIFSSNMRYGIDFTGWTLNQLYPNYLGARPDAVIRNWTQPLFMTAPEIGGWLGHKHVMRGTMKTLARMKRGENLEEFLQSLGHAPGQYLGHGMHPASEALHSTWLGKLVAAGDRFGALMMHWYSKSDVLNRTITLDAAEGLLDDIVKGVPQARKFFQQLGPGYRYRIGRAIQDDDLKTAHMELANFLISKTQFNYGVNANAELGRDIGRLGTMFTKWPAMIMGSVDDVMQSKQMTRVDKFSALTQRMFAPLMLLSFVDTLLEDTKDSPLRKLILGRSFASYAPAQSIMVSVPPGLEVGGDLAQSLLDALQGDLDTAGNRMSKVSYTFAPSFVHLAPKLVERFGYNLFDEKAPWKDK